VKPGIELRRKGNASWIRLGADTQQKEAETANQAAEAWVRMHPKDKPVGGLQVTEGGDLWQEMEHPDGTLNGSAEGTSRSGHQGQGERRVRRRTPAAVEFELSPNPERRRFT